MNRRELFKTGAAAVAALAVPKIASAEPIRLNPVNRMVRYKEYKEILEQTHLIGLALMDILHNAAIAVPECEYVPVANGFQVGLPYPRLYRLAFDLAVAGDSFYELIFEPNDTRPILYQALSSDTIYRIETVKGKLLEFQQSRQGPDYSALSRPIDSDRKSHAVRFTPEQIYQLSIGTNEFYPYGVSLLEPIRKNKNAEISEGAVKNFHKIFVDGMAELSRKIGLGGEVLYNPR